MDFLPVTSSLQVLELVYKLHPHLADQHVRFAEGNDISLGLVETRTLSAVLTAHPTLLQLEDTVATLRCVDVRVSNEAALVKLNPIQEMHLSLNGEVARIDALPLPLPAKTPYGNLVQHLFMARLEAVLGTLDVSQLSVKLATDSLEALADTVRLRAYKCDSMGYSKTLTGFKLV